MKFNFLKLVINNRAQVSHTVLGIITAVLLLLPIAEVADAGALTSARDTLGTSRPSAATTIGSTITAGDTTINVGSTTGFLQGDTITICNATCSTSETKIIASVINTTQLGLTAGASNSYSSGNVYYKSTSKHTIAINTRSSVTAGKFIVTIPATNTTTPQSASFALNSITTGDISLAGATAGSISTSTSGSNILFTIPFTGTLAAGSNATVTIGSTLFLLNPTKTAAQGTADISQITVTETDGSGNTIDSTTLDVGTIEPVTVSATVAPSLNFTINGVAASTSVTAHGTSVTTTATTVPFGTLTVNASTTAAQYVHVDTNSNSGYFVTVQQDGSLRKTNGTTIVDFNSSAPADNDGSTGFGFALQNKSSTSGLTLPFNYNDSSRKFNSIGFSSTSPYTIMSNSGPANGDEVYVDYYLKVNAQQAQGNYQNVVTYIATATY